MSDYRDEREAALQRAEVLAQQNAQLQAELDSLRQGRASPATTRTPRVVALVLGATVAMGAVSGMLLAVRRPPPLVGSSLDLRGVWSPPARVADVALRAAVRAAGGTWVVGDRGAIFYRPESSTAWARVPSGTEADLYAISSGDPLIAVGAHGTALRFDPAERRWVSEHTGTTADLRALTTRRFSAPQGTVTAVGDGGTVLTRQPEGTWSGAVSPTQANLYGVTSAGNDFSLVAVGAGGVIVGVPSGGGALSLHASPVTTTLRAVAAWNNTLLAVGDGGVIVSAAAMSPWTVVASGTTVDLFAVTAAEIPYEERRPSSVSSGAMFGFVAAGAGGSVLVDRLGSIEGWREVRAGGAAVRAITAEPWGFYTVGGTGFGFTPR